MPNDQLLFGKTFDQQLIATKGRIKNRDISPNRRISGEIVFEPLGNGIRVTARDKNHKVLWGYIGSKETVKQAHCLVAVYDTLQGILGDELSKRGLFSPESDNQVLSTTLEALDRLETTIKNLRNGLKVKKVSKATIVRAKRVGRVISDVERQISYELDSIKGVQSPSEASDSADITNSQ